MESEPDLARIAATVGDARRIRMLALLMEGRALTAKELALGTGVEPATATSHLKRLVDDGLLVAASQGRHKYFRFASEQVAQLVESLMRVAPRRKAPAPAAHEPIRAARFCYDHLAGSLGTGLLALWLRKGWLADGGDPKQLEVTARGEKALAALGVDLAAARARRRQFACRCLDWSERQDHLGGALGAAVAEHFRAQRWIERSKHSRVVRVTPQGERELRRLGLAEPR
ncbi:helix-turn-helix transcriptional regulator [Ramlibacter solisilvae]|uniref:ArsR family transcriptional regulator n=1 Tax=Ramlibacter tataouinensis TaxID=94132 RepID=A0A127JUQ0_9BURK|nr:winged helix-turn-helix domain-containing protein [Ramlibacter tataouinensis]AMO21742.1 ArsR family transcriptional regulator [Ramlibacter tataouinensis]